MSIWHRQGQAVVLGAKAIGFGQAAPPQIVNTPKPPDPERHYMGSGGRVGNTKYEYIQWPDIPWSGR
jgi:hypothetical protein